MTYQDTLTNIPVISESACFKGGSVDVDAPNQEGRVGRGLGREEASENGTAALPRGGGPLRGAASKEEEAEEGVRRCS